MIFLESCTPSRLQAEVLPEQRRVQVAGVQVTLDASLPALVELTGLLPVRRRSVLLQTLAAPLCKGCKIHSSANVFLVCGLTISLELIDLQATVIRCHRKVFLPTELHRST